jgi:hypothetical protein
VARLALEIGRRLWEPEIILGLTIDHPFKEQSVYQLVRAAVPALLLLQRSPAIKVAGVTVAIDPSPTSTSKLWYQAAHLIRCGCSADTLRALAPDDI